MMVASLLRRPAARQPQYLAPLGRYRRQPPHRDAGLDGDLDVPLRRRLHQRLGALRR